ncbi:unnamed protein product [Aphanomyces euteiches]
MRYDNHTIGRFHVLINNCLKASKLFDINIMLQRQVTAEQPPALGEFKSEIACILRQVPPTKPISLTNKSTVRIKPIKPIMVA